MENGFMSRNAGYYFFNFYGVYLINSSYTTRILSKLSSISGGINLEK